MTILDDILAAIAAALIVALAVLLIINANMRADLARADASAIVLGRANADLKNAAVKQNAALAALEAESDAKSLAAEQAVKLAALRTRRAEAAAAGIAREPASGGRGGDCAAATRVLRDYLKGR